jgi:hypothetical protein
MTESARATIVNELLAKPSAVAPTLFVGLGGAGCKMVNRIYKHVKARHDYEERFKELTQFAYLDTNIHDLEKFRADGAADLFLISDFEKAEYSKLAGGKAYLDADDYFTQWVPSNYRFRTGDTAGAGQIRIESRLGMYYQVKHKDFVQRFRSMIEKLKDHSHGHRRLDSQEIRIVIAYSVAGGTGSGCHLPISYLLRELASQYGKPLIFGIAALSSVFEDKVGTNKDGVFANGYAALKETEYLMKLGAPESKFFPENGRRTFHYNPSDPTRRSVDAKPFDVLWVIDRPESFHVSDVLAAAGDAIYLQLFTPIYSEQAGDFDNYTQHQRFLVPHDFESKGIPGYTAFYGGIGAAVLHVPDKSILEYCSKRGALAVIESSFLQGIPGGETYAGIAANMDVFNEVPSLDGTGRPVREVDFVKRSKEDREALRNKLFQKRVRLLAFAEEEGTRGVDFFRLAMRHGEGARWLPQKDGKLRRPLPVAEGKSVGQADMDLARWSTEQLSKNLLGASMAHFPLNALESSDGEASSLQVRLIEDIITRLSDKAKEMCDDFVAKKRRQEVKKGLLKGGGTELKKVKKSAVMQEVERIEEELRGEVQSLLERSTETAPDGLDWIPGFTWLESGAFLTGKGAAEQNLVAKRYAVLSVLDRVEALLVAFKKRDDAEKAQGDDGGPSKVSGSSGPTDSGGGDGGGDREFDPETELAGQLLGPTDDGLVRVKAFAEGEFRKRLEGVQRKLSGYARVFTTLQEQYEPLRARQEEQAERLRVDGSAVDTEKFMLDGEALQIESKRRMWDFYFEDQVRYLPQLDVSSEPALAQTLSQEVQRLVDLQLRDEPTPADALEVIYQAISSAIARSLNNAVVGDPRSASEPERHGLTLQKALELEVRYRAIYLSNRAKVDGQDPKSVANLMASMRGSKDGFDLKDPLHLDYLKDKLKRLIKERSDLICYLDEKHLSQGGTRPNEVFLAALHEDLHKGLLKEVLGESLGMRPPKVITKDVEDRKMVVFYRAILNVPLYVFGRMRELRACYHQFKGMARRPKVLHIDKNWEDALPDLDPAVVEEEHRQLTIRNSVLDFAALLSAGLREVDEALPDQLDTRPAGGSDEDNLEEAVDTLRAGGGARCVVWRSAQAGGGRRLGDVASEATGGEGAREWVLRTPLRVRATLNRDGQSWEQIDGSEAVLGTTMSETILRIQDAIRENPKTYKQYKDLLRWVRVGQMPLIFDKVITVPGDWQRYHEGLRNRYGRNPTEAQQRQLDDIKNVYTKLANALVDLLAELDLRNREESGLITDKLVTDTLAGTAPAIDLDTVAEKERLQDSIALLQKFKREWTGADKKPPARTGGLFGRVSKRG